MAKVTAPISNDYCPQTLFMYGTYKEDGTPNFGLFCWFSYCENGGLGVMACIGGSKLTLDRIRETRVFSANLVTESVLPLADYFGMNDGYLSDKMNVPYTCERGAVLDVPVLGESPLAFELELERTIPLNGSEVLLCRIRNVLVDPKLTDGNATNEEKLRAIAPVRTTCCTYFGWQGGALGAWGEPGLAIKHKEA